MIKFAGCYHGHADAFLAERRLRARDARDPVARPACRPASPPTRSSCAYNDVDARRGRGRALRRGARRDHRRAGRREHGLRPAGAGLPRGAARCSATRRGALLVFDEVITGFRVARGGAQERFGVTARPDDPRQDRRRRPAARGVRRARRGDGAARAGRATSTRPGRSPGTRSRPRPGSRCCAGCATRPSTRSSSAARARLEDGPRAVRPRAARRRDAHALRRRDEPVDAASTRARHRALRRALPRPARARHLRRAEPVRVPVPLARPRRRGDRRDGRGGRRRSSVADRLGRRSPPRRARESPLWAQALLPAASASSEPVFSPLAPERFALGLETIYEAYLVHYGAPRLFDPPDDGRARAARRLPLRARARPDRRGRRRRRGRRDGRADLALRRAARGRRAPATATRGSTPRARSAASPATTRSRDALAGTPLESRRDRRIDRVIFDAAQPRASTSSGMLIVGLIFLAVIALGELDRWARPPPRRARAGARRAGRS